MPTGIYSRSGALPPSWSQISNEAVFWPSILNGLTELRTYIPSLSDDFMTMSSAWSKLPLTETTVAPCIMA
ncbi:MAG: hypothetical protein A3K67_04670 [Euryarchaeota archaeon RBG_16_62_10]|nr:MAG: hypothetical protein A3K67_04670 [Euryarchaeota archaeon RBG_16_62_10]